jgi:DNA-binding SARP family transcriptional activator
MRTRLNALETCIDLELQLGRHRQLVGEIAALVEEYPLRERLRCLYMMVLYRSRRPADALEVYRTGRPDPGVRAGNGAR